MPTSCIETTDEDRATHAWEARGLDTDTEGRLVNVRRCIWCQTEQSKPYGAGSRKF
jgi:hypothetical protein